MECFSCGIKDNGMYKPCLDNKLLGHVEQCMDPEAKTCFTFKGTHSEDGVGEMVYRGCTRYPEMGVAAKMSTCFEIDEMGVSFIKS